MLFKLWLLSNLEKLPGLTTHQLPVQNIWEFTAFSAQIAKYFSHADFIAKVWQCKFVYFSLVFKDYGKD
jgi:hypothetical protein